jgi:hypothetical protein
MEQLHHVIINAYENVITFCGDRGTQKSVQFHVEEQFLFSVSYCQQRMNAQHIYYI